jgi:hypothetical protein
MACYGDSYEYIEIKFGLIFHNLYATMERGSFITTARRDLRLKTHDTTSKAPFLRRDGLEVNNPSIQTPETC